MNKKVTMRDIAEKLGITAAAVSKAFTGNGSISDELKNKIINTAADMGYSYEENAHKKKSLSNNIGIIVAERYISDNSFYFKFISSISSSLQRHGNYAFFHTLSMNNEARNTLPDFFSTQRVDGIIILGQISDEYTRTVLNTHIPVVFLDFYNELTANSCVVCDGFYATYEMTNSLIRKGHRKIAFVGNIHSTSSIQDRYLGYAKSLIEHNIPLNEQYCISDRNEDDGKFIPIELPVFMPTAFVCNCDEIACKLISQLNQNGYRVPEDISVTGFDNSVYSSICNPNITTVEVNTEQMANIAVDTLLTKIKMPSQQTGMIQVKGKIINKDSVKAIDA